MLHREVYGEYNEFEEEAMDFSSLRVIEKLHKEMEDVRRSREEAVSRAELDRQRLRDTARNILRLGLSVEQVTQTTGLPRETVQTLAAQL
jgi:predicted transposase YdaD